MRRKAKTKTDRFLKILILFLMPILIWAIFFIFKIENAGAVCFGDPTSCESLGSGICATCGCDWTPGACSNVGSCGGCADSTNCNNCTAAGCSWDLADCYNTGSCDSCADDNACNACSCANCSVSSCPFVYVWNGEDYEFVAETITPFTIPEAESPILTRLPNLVPKEGEYLIKIKEELYETSFINDLFLLAVDHPKDTEVYPDIFGNIHTIKEKISANSCLNEEGENCLDLFGENDGKIWNTPDEEYWRDHKSTEIDENGNLISDDPYDLYSWAVLTFPKPENIEKAKLVWHAKEHITTSWAWYQFKNLLGYNNPELLKKYIDNGMLLDWFSREIAGIQLEIWDGEKWNEEYLIIEASASKKPTEFSHMIDISNIPGTELKIKFKGIYGIRGIDSVKVDYSKDSLFLPYFNVIPSYPQKAVINGNSVLNAVSKIDNKRALIDQGDEMYVSFPEKYKILPNTKRSYILVATGYYFGKYEKIIEEPDIELIERILMESRFGPKYFFPRYFGDSKIEFNEKEDEEFKCSPYFPVSEKGCYFPLIVESKINHIFPIKPNIFDWINIIIKTLTIIAVILLFIFLEKNISKEKKLLRKNITIIFIIIITIILIMLLNNINEVRSACRGTLNCNNCNESDCGTCTQCAWDSAGPCEGTLNCTGLGEGDCTGCNQCSWTAGNCSSTPSLCSNHNNQSDCTSCGCNWNDPPSVSNVSLNTGSNINLIEDSTTTVLITATLSDADGGDDISSSTCVVYRSGKGSACSADSNDCYQIGAGDCQLSTATGNDKTATCTAVIWFNADPTDVGTPWSGEIWSAEITAIDSMSQTGNATNTGENVDIISLLAFKVTPSIDYGDLTSEEKIDPLNVTSTITSTGNCSLDAELYGTNMIDNGNSILVSKQKYTTSSVSYDSAISLTTSPQELEINLAKTTDSENKQTTDIFWGIEIPNPTPVGAYKGTNTFIGVKNETPWP